MSNRERFLWLAAYVAIMVGIIVSLFVVRSRALTSLSTPEARADWQAWRDAAAKQSAEGPVRRRVSKSTEPPALILMRDHFPVMLTGSLFFGTALFSLIGWAGRGAFGRK